MHRHWIYAFFVGKMIKFPQRLFTSSPNPARFGLAAPRGWNDREMEGAVERKVLQGKQLLPQEVFNGNSQKGTTLAFWKEDALVLNI